MHAYRFKSNIFFADLTWENLRESLGLGVTVSRVLGDFIDLYTSSQVLGANLILDSEI